MESPSTLKPALLLTAAAILLAMMHFAASLLVPILLAFFITTLLGPICNGLKRRRAPGDLAPLLTIGFLSHPGTNSRAKSQTQQQRHLG